MMNGHDLPPDDDHATEPDGAAGYAHTLARLSRSRFRGSFHLQPADLRYLLQQGPEAVAQHAAQFIAKRLAPASPENDGKQTPWRGHPVFVAQHATATCCRGCLAKWHGMPGGVALTQAQQHHVVELISAWLAAQAQGKDLEQATREEARLKERAAARKARSRQEASAGADGNDDQNRQGRLF